MTRKIRRTGTKALAALMAAVLVLSVFSAPAAAAAGDVESAETVTISADELSSGSTTETFNSTLNLSSTASQGDQIIIEIDSSPSAVDEGDLLVAGASLKDADVDNGGNVTSTDNLSVTTFNGGVFSSAGDDSVAITFDDGVGDVTTDEIEVSIDLEIDPAVRTEVTSSEFTGTSVLTVATDEVGSLDGGTVGNLDVQPGSPDALNLGSDQVGDITFSGNDSINVRAEDQFGNLIQGSSGTVSLSNFEAGYSDLDTGAELFDSSNSQIDSFDIGNKTIGYTSNSSSVTVNVNPGADNPDEINRQIVGDELTFTANASGLTNDTAEVDIRPNSLSFTHNATTIQNNASGELGPHLSADTGEVGVELELEDGSGNVISNSNIDEIRVDFTSIDSNSVSPELETTDGRTVDSSDSTLIVSKNLNGSDDLTFKETDNGYDIASLDVQVDTRGSGTTTPSASTDRLNVVAGTPDTLATSNDPIQADMESTVSATVTVEIQDAQGNVIDDRDFGDTGFKINTSHPTPGEIDSVTGDIATATGDGTKTVDLEKASADGSELGIAAGELDVQVVQQKSGGSLGTTVDGATATLDAIPDLDTNSTDNINSDIDAGTTSSGPGSEFTVHLNETDGDVFLADEDIAEVEIEFVLDNTTVVPTGAPFSGTLDPNGADAKTVTVSTTTTEETVNYNITSASNYDITANATIDSTDSTDVTSNSFAVNALAFDESNSNINVGNDFIGVVYDDNDSVVVTFELRDKFNNYAAYNNPNLGNASQVAFEIAGTEFTSDLFGDAEPGTDQATLNVEEANEEFTLTIDPDSTLSATSTLGDADAEVLDANGDVNETNAVELGHEAYNLDEGVNRMSVPQPVQSNGLLTENTGNTLGWDAQNQTYDTGEVTLGSVGDAELHNGIIIEGSDASARVGFQFDTTQQSNVGSATLQDGWNYVGTNFDVSESSNNPLALEEDLLTVGAIADDPSSNQVVLDGSLSVTLDASSTGDDTSSLQPNALAFKATPGGADGEFGTYWVYIEDTDSFSGSVDRQIVRAGYSASDRDSQ